MSAHTPGPWEVATEPGKKTAEGDCYAIISTPKGAAFDFLAAPGMAVEHDANASLIAAAPELLVALKDRFAWCDCGTSRTGQAVCDECQRDSKLIAKAEGRK